MKRGWPLLLVCASCSSGPAIAPHGIVSNNPCIDSILAEVAAPGQIAAVSAYSHSVESGSAPLAWARALPALGTSAEEIIAAKPRLLLTGNLPASGTHAALKLAGINMIQFGVPASVKESIAQVRQISKAIGRTIAGDRLISRMESSLLPAAHPPQSAIIWLPGGFVPGKGTLQDELLSSAGYSNASTQFGLNQWDMLPLEAMMRHPPDVIFMPLSAPGADGRSLIARKAVMRHLSSHTHMRAFPEKLLFCGGPTIIAAMKALR